MQYQYHSVRRGHSECRK